MTISWLGKLQMLQKKTHDVGKFMTSDMFLITIVRVIILCLALFPKTERMYSFYVDFPQILTPK